MEEFLKTYTSQVEPAMSFESRKAMRKAFRIFWGLIIIVGTGLCGMIGLIGILNFFNVTLTGIAARKREFAMLQSIGMTNDQLLKTLVCEGISYIAISGGISLLLGSLFPGWRCGFE